MTEWVEVVDREYLSDFIPAGGGCVKFAVGSGGAAREACDNLESLALGHGFLFIELGAKDTRLNRSDQIFFDVAKNIDWDRFASQYVRSALEKQGWSLVISGDSGGLLDFSAMAVTNNIEETAIRACLKEALMRLYQNYSMSQEFRLAMLQLCRAQIAGFEHSAEPVKRWLRGELTRISEVKNAKLFQKVGRQNARFMFHSLTHWLRLNGAPGLVLTIDISRCLEQVKKADRDAGHYYSSSALTEVYEVLRQLIDGSSGLNGTMIAVFAPESFLSDERRGVDRYQALKMRIFDDVRNRGIQNFLAPLVRLWQEAA
jgi:hypothetical protein